MAMTKKISLLILTILTLSTMRLFAKEQAPDFRYPETVISQALKQINDASRKGNDERLVDGLIRLAMAKSAISSDYMPQTINYIDSIAHTTDNVATRSIMLSLEADLTFMVYNSDSYRYNERQKAGTTRPDDIREWSRDDFYDRIVQLTDSAMTEKTTLQATPLSRYSQIFTHPSVCPEFVTTLYDAIAHNAVALLKQVAQINNYDRPNLILIYLSPSAGTPSEPLKIKNKALQQMARIYDSVLAAHNSNDAAYIYTLLQKADNIGDNDMTDIENTNVVNRLLDIYDSYRENPYSLEFLIEAINRNDDINYDDNDDEAADNAPRLTAAVEEAIRLYPKYPRVNILRNYMLEINQKRLTIIFPQRVRTSDNVEITINSHNVKEVTVTAYRIPYDARIRDVKWLKTKPIQQRQTFIVTDKSQTVQFPAMPKGRYVLFPSFKNAAGKTIEPEYISSTITVSDIDIMLTSRLGGEKVAVVVDALTSKPVEGAKIIQSADSQTLSTTDSLGIGSLSKINKKSWSTAFYAEKDGDRSQTVSFYSDSYTASRDKRLAASVYTDRGVYRPGEKVKYAAILYNRGYRFLEVAAKQRIEVVLFDANNKEVTHTDATSDEFGRVSGEFSLPDNGLTGSFSIQLRSDGRHIDWYSFEVSEYKAPTFYFDIDRENSTTDNRSNVIVRGRLLTYSQYPIANTPLKVNIRKSFSWWERVQFDDYDTEVTTDSEGRFEVCVPEEKFSGKGRINLSFTFTATDSRGESQQETANFSVGQFESLPLLSDITANADTPVSLPLEFAKFERLNYEISNNNGTVTKGEITPDNTRIDTRGVPSGQYTLTVSMPDGKDKKTAALRLYRKSDDAPLFDTMFLSTDSENVKCDPDGTFAIPYGNSRPTHLFYIVQCGAEVTDYGWSDAQTGWNTLRGKAKFARYEESKVTVVWLDRHNAEKRVFSLMPPVSDDSVKIVTETFRDKLTPGSRETWRLRVVNNNGKKYRSAVIVNMYDAALNTIAGNTVAFNPYPLTDNGARISLEALENFTSARLAEDYKPLNYKTFYAPWLNYYGRLYYTNPRIYGTRMYKLAANKEVLYADSADLSVAAEAATETSEVANYMFQEAAIGSSNSLNECIVVTTDPDSSTSSRSSELRDDGIKTAFFLPGLVTDDNGVLTFSFDVPNRNTQWQFTAIAYTDDLQADCINKLVSASKPIMVETNLPRFVRSGDKAAIRTAVMNNSDASQTVDLAITVNDKRLVTKTLTLQAGESAVETTEITADSREPIIVTAELMRDGSRIDGERDKIEILPATSDVIEAEPFYLKPDVDKATVKIPSFGEKGTLTLEYSDNAAWYAATALPSMVKSAETATAHVNNYYTTVVASRIVSDNPDIARAITDWKEKDSLRSPLEKNTDLKTVSLDNTIWVNEAKTESQIMNNLADLTDPVEMQLRKIRAIAGLADLQLNDGGFAWFKHGDSSPYITENVLYTLGMLNDMGYLDTDDNAITGIARKAIDYCDNYYSEYSKKRGVTRDDVINAAADYVITRAMLGLKPAKGDMLWIEKGVINLFKNKWGDYSPITKAEIATYLANKGERKTAADIVESLRQTARKSPNRGMYWDVNSYYQVSIAARALKAFHTLNADDPAIDEIRLWLLLSKETQSWNSSIFACEAINALLTTGTQWAAADRRRPEIKIGRQTIDTTDASQYFGYIRRDFDISGKKGEITIRRQAGCPAWGAVYCRYNAPMDSLKKFSSDDIRIEKQFFTYNDDQSLADAPTTNLKVGQRVQVRLSVRSERDLQFVCVTDDRAACLEPLDQTSFYDSQDGLWFYRETRDDKTNIFFDRMPKGSYIITYDAFVNNAGQFTSGMATVQCQYAPQLVSHTAGNTIAVK